MPSFNTPANVKTLAGVLNEGTSDFVVSDLDDIALVNSVVNIFESSTGLRSGLLLGYHLIISSLR